MVGWIGKKTKQELYCPFFSLSPCLPILGSSNNDDDDDDVIQRLFPHTHTTYIETYIFHSRFPYISIGNTFNRIECERQNKKFVFLLCFACAIYNNNTLKARIKNIIERKKILTVAIPNTFSMCVCVLNEFKNSLVGAHYYYYHHQYIQPMNYFFPFTTPDFRIYWL